MSDIMNHAFIVHRRECERSRLEEPWNCPWFDHAVLWWADHSVE